MKFRFLKPKLNKREMEIMKVCCEMILTSIDKREEEGTIEPIEKEVKVDLEKIIKKITL